MKYLIWFISVISVFVFVFVKLSSMAVPPSWQVDDTSNASKIKWKCTQKIFKKFLYCIQNRQFRQLVEVKYTWHLELINIRYGSIRQIGSALFRCLLFYKKSHYLMMSKGQKRDSVMFYTLSTLEYICTLFYSCYSTDVFFLIKNHTIQWS